MKGNYNEGFGKEKLTKEWAEKNKSVPNLHIPTKQSAPRHTSSVPDYHPRKATLISPSEESTPTQEDKTKAPQALADNTLREKIDHGKLQDVGSKNKAHVKPKLQAKAAIEMFEQLSSDKSKAASTSPSSVTPPQAIANGGSVRQRQAVFEAAEREQGASRDIERGTTRLPFQQTPQSPSRGLSFKAKCIIAALSVAAVVVTYKIVTQH